MTDWTEEQKAMWVLEHGEPDIAWIFERNDQIVYRRPLARNGGLIPPWISLTRQQVKTSVAESEQSETLLKRQRAIRKRVSEREFILGEHT